MNKFWTILKNNKVRSSLIALIIAISASLGYCGLSETAFNDIMKVVNEVISELIPSDTPQPEQPTEQIQETQTKQN